MRHNVSLKAYNTFGIDMPAEYFVELSDEAQLQEISGIELPKHPLGGGSNILLTRPVKGMVIQNKLKGISLEKEDENHVWLKVQSGEVWHEFVMYAIAHGWAGIENLALIPGTVGAAPMQNIGAYGVEAKEVIETVTAWHWHEKVYTTYNNADCKFGYRDSIFKHLLKNEVFITSVTFRLNKIPVYHTAYGAIEQELQRMNPDSYRDELSIAAIANAVINIRTSKLPDPKQIGNAGSFFKNPTIPLAQFESLQTAHPHIPHYPAGNDKVKVPAGWLIEQCGWKGYRKGNTGVHEKQALVLVNYGHAVGSEIWQLSEEICASVTERFGINLEREVQVW